MTRILGISALYHDSAAALVVDGRIVAAAQEERFSRKKHDHRLPLHAIRYCLVEGGIGPAELDYVGFYDKPLLKFDRLLETYLSYAPAGFRSFLKAMPLWLHEKLHVPREIRKGLDRRYEGPLIFTEHHESHAASAFFASPFEEAAILTFDGVGEWATASFGHGRGNRIALTHELHFPHSLGLLYSAFTYFCGFKVNSGEYKLMGLAPYGSPRYADLIREHLVEIKDDGSLRLDMSYFNYCQGLTMTSRRFERLFGGPKRRPESPVTEREMDLAASVQLVTEEILLRAARHVHRQTGLRNLCLAGGVALNCVANGRLLREGPFEELWIQPAAGDAGGALGVALFIWHQLLGHPRLVPSVKGSDAQMGSLLGPAYSEDLIRSFLERVGARYEHIGEDGELYRRVADLIAGQKVVGWLQGRMEFGPRALGSRSILGDPRSTEMQSVMNIKIKFRESFRPFAPAVLRERVSDYFELRPEEDSPYMLLVASVNADRRIPPDDGGPGGNGRQRGLAAVREVRSDVPAITHVDYSARVQTVDQERNGPFYRLLRAFEERTGCPVLINTSFNVRGEPIVCSPEDAYRCFMATNMDVLVLDHFVLMKDNQPDTMRFDRKQYLEQFELD